MALIREYRVIGHRETMFSGKHITITEDRAVLHVASRNRSNTSVFLDGEDVMPLVRTCFSKCALFANRFAPGNGRDIPESPSRVLSILTLAVLTLPLRWSRKPCQRPHQHFVSNADGTQLAEILRRLDPRTILFIVASKTFTTQETLLNASSAKKIEINPQNIFEF